MDHLTVAVMLQKRTIMDLTWANDQACFYTLALCIVHLFADLKSILSYDDLDLFRRRQPISLLPAFRRTVSKILAFYGVRFHRAAIMCAEKLMISQGSVCAMYVSVFQKIGNRRIPIHAISLYLVFPLDSLRLDAHELLMRIGFDA
ncbi:hypothetical protein M514_05606 [Trichuris suis]|uniref:Uncharacterized protein n=1 Tax=Trichuris suis TaxID=68888 RepID=A0A085M8F4_9BILA|nr:hypothetical protein M513_05606 [Trichuris suis]KFD71829.1 hypothetical protein M514_05606 [Trichuris suis]